MDRKTLEALLELAYHDGYVDGLNDLKERLINGEQDRNSQGDQ